MATVLERSVKMTEEAYAAHQKRVNGHPPVENRAARLERAPGTRNRGLRKRKGPNKTEAAFGEWLAKANPLDVVEFESMSLKMPGGTRYTPDWCAASDYKPPDFYEVKGFMREAARVRLKEFAAHFHMFRFFLVRAKDRSLTSWDIQEVR